jgi:hypothetical protein
LFRYRKGIIDFDTEISNGTLYLGMAEQKLYGTQVAGTSIDQRRFRALQPMRAEQLGIQPDAGDPPGDKPRVLARRHTSADPAAAREQKFARLLARGSQIVIDGSTGLVCQLELDRLSRLTREEDRWSCGERSRWSWAYLQTRHGTAWLV